MLQCNQLKYQIQSAFILCNKKENKYCSNFPLPRYMVWTALLGTGWLSSSSVVSPCVVSSERRVSRLSRCDRRIAAASRSDRRAAVSSPYRSVSIEIGSRCIEVEVWVDRRPVWVDNVPAGRPRSRTTSGSRIRIWIGIGSSIFGVLRCQWGWKSAGERLCPLSQA